MQISVISMLQPSERTSQSRVSAGGSARRGTAPGHSPESFKPIKGPRGSGRPSTSLRHQVSTVVPASQAGPPPQSSISAGPQSTPHSR